MSKLESRDSGSEQQRVDFELLRKIRNRLALTRLADRARFARELDRLFSRRERGGDFDTIVAKLTSALDASVERVESLRAAPLSLNYDANLPITSHREAILAALAKHQVIVLCGATGSGKTTQLPKFCLEAGRGAFGLIGHTQPRRIAARAIASRLASELGTTLGSAVGYQVRFNDRSGADTRVKLMTDGILLKELESDRFLYRYDTLIIDEAHERSLNIDLLLGALKGVLAKRADLKLIVTSATIDPLKFSEFFGGAPVIEVSGRSYPVEVRYRPLQGEDEDDTDLSLPEGVVEAVRELDKSARGDVLVFLPGEKQIRECNDELIKAKLFNTEILPLFSRLSAREQEQIFEGHRERRVVLATNVAETSLTVPGIRNVIDSGLARISRYSVRGKVQRLPIEKISKASADQRKGRCGREAEGICIRLFAEEDFESREAFTPPEILRTNLASVILKLAVLGIGDPTEFPFVDPPDTRLINDGYRLLQELKAVDADRNVTALGRQIASLPVDPRLARMLIAASRHACLAEMLIVTSFLEIQDPRERPADAQTQADQAHAEFADPRSDFISVLNLWAKFHEQSELLSGSQLRKWCREHFLSFVRMREWQELHRQLSESVKEIELRVNATPASYANLHEALLTGFLGNIGVLEEKREYLGARGTRFTIAPGTPLATKPPKWIVAGSIMETTRVFARMVAGIEPEWIERAGEHLLKRSYAEAEWNEHKGFVSALQSVALYGITLVGQRRINYGSVAPKEAREIFIREALVEERTAFRPEFLAHNARLKEEIEKREAKIRRRDVLVEDGTLCDFYRARLPEQVHSIPALQKWLRANDKGELCMTLADLMKRETPEVTQENFPDAVVLSGNTLRLSYVFEPGQPNDGATLELPEPLLASLDAAHLQWLMPGWHLDRVTALLRSLPKELRKHFVPVPDAALRCLRSIGAPNDLSLSAWIARESGASFTKEELVRLVIPDYLQLNLRVIRLDGKLLSEGRDLLALKRDVRKLSSEPRGTEDIAHRSWDFEDLPIEKTVARGGVQFVVYPALQVTEQGVRMIECGTSNQASIISRRGVTHLAMYAMPQQVKLIQKEFTDKKEIALLSHGIASQKVLSAQFVERVFRECFLPDGEPLPRTQAEFQKLLSEKRDRIGATLNRLMGSIVEIFKAVRAVRELLRSPDVGRHTNARSDMDKQLAALLPEDFLTSTPNPWFGYLPKYLKGIQRRLERLTANAKRDAELQQQIAPYMKSLEKLESSPGSKLQAEVQKLRWMVEEFRISLFAQELKASIPVSDKRLQEQLANAQKEALS